MWEDAIAVLRIDPPEHDQCFIHRDFGPRNVLWSDGQVSRVVDWVATSLDPAWLDVAHCCTNITLVRGNQPAHIFANAYTQRTGRAAQPYFDVMDIAGFLPPPGREGLSTSPPERAAPQGPPTCRANAAPRLGGDLVAGAGHARVGG